MRKATIAWIPALTIITVAAAAESQPSLAPEQQTEILNALRPHMVRVEYDLRFDKGEPPAALGWLERCPNCGNIHGFGDGEELVREKRPLEVGGWLLTPNTVLTRDMQIHPRFVQSVAVRAGNRLIAARITKRFRNENGCLLELAEPVSDLEPMRFDAARGGPYFAITYTQDDADWAAAIAPLSAALSLTDGGRRFTTAPNACVIVDQQGFPVGASMDGALAADGSWKGAPSEWPGFSDEELTALMAHLDDVTSSGILPVTLNFRSPKAAANRMQMMWRDDDESSPTELRAFALLQAPTRLLVLANLEAKQTARLERILVHLPDAAPVEARFEASLRDWGCFVATLDEPGAAPLPAAEAPITAARDELVFFLTARYFGDEPIIRHQSARLAGFLLREERQVYPIVYGDESNLFCFSAQGELLAFPVTRREALSDEYSRWRNDSVRLTPCACIFKSLGGARDAFDPNNVPLSEAEENRVAWLGVEMQNLDSDLATVNGVSEITNDGEMGAMVSYVYPDSPASAAGLAVGDILLQLHVPEHHRPVPVRNDGAEGLGFDFPWDRLSEVPEEYLSEIPQPWPSVQAGLNELLTEIGFGKPFELELVRSGESRRIPMVVTESPAYYDSARQFKSEDLGFTVKDLTYEVRRYFQLGPDDSGVIIARIEPGSKAYVAGLRPYEIIQRIDDDPVVDAPALEERLTNAGGEVRLDVKRMTSTRVVKLRVAEKVESE